jgi:WD40 repeat protein
VIVWEPGTGNQPRKLKEHLGGLSFLAFSPDSRRLASGGGGDSTVIIWDTTTWKALGTLKHTGPVTGVAFSPVDTFLATCSSDGKVKIWNTTTWEEKRTLRVLDEDSHQLRDVAFSPDGKRLACASWDQTVKVWDLTSSGAEPRTIVGHAGSVFTVAWAPDGKRFASGSGYRGKGEIKIWDTSLWSQRLQRSSP